MSLVQSRCRHHTRHCTHPTPSPQHNPAHSRKRHRIIRSTPMVVGAVVHAGVSTCIDFYPVLQALFLYSAGSCCWLPTVIFIAACAPMPFKALQSGFDMHFPMNEPLWCTMTANAHTPGVGRVSCCCRVLKSSRSDWQPQGTSLHKAQALL